MDSANDAWIKVQVLKVAQPIGGFYCGVMNHKDLIKIAFSDIRRINTEKRDIETYLGIERPLRGDRVAELKEYVNTVDATFPSPIILAVEEKDTDWEDNTGMLLVKSRDNVAKILDGQHRIEGLSAFEGERFDVLVTIFVEMDIEYQALVFATINLQQTKVNRSLAYDLYSYATTRSPHKTCHHIVRLLNSRSGSPFQNKIKILGVAGDKSETISQALFVDTLLPMISKNPNKDRDELRRGRAIEQAEWTDTHALIFRKLFIEKKDAIIARVLWNYFQAVEHKWGKYWTDVIPRRVLNRTTGFRGLMQFLPFAYVAAGGLNKDPVKVEFDEIFDRVRISGDDITPDAYPPGTTGAARFRDHLKGQAGIE